MSSMGPSDQSLGIGQPQNKPAFGCFSGNTSEGPFHEASKPLPGTWYSDLAELQKHFHLLEARLRTLLHGNIQGQERFEKLERQQRGNNTMLDNLHLRIVQLELPVNADQQEAAIPEEPPVTVHCPGCGSVVPESVPNSRFVIPARSNFCVHCGQSLKRDQEPTQLKVLGKLDRNPDVLAEKDELGEPRWRCAYCGLLYTQREQANYHAATCQYNPTHNSLRAR